MDHSLWGHTQPFISKHHQENEHTLEREVGGGGGVKAYLFVDALYMAQGSIALGGKLLRLSPKAAVLCQAGRIKQKASLPLPVPMAWFSSRQSQSQSVGRHMSATQLRASGGMPSNTKPASSMR